MKRWFAAGLLALPALYALDYAVFKARGGAAMGSVRVRRTYQVQEKNKKLEYFTLPPEDQACTETLFPQSGLHPTCWWLRRHTAQVSEM